MSVGRALVDCALLSLRDACVFYPLCKGCFSRIDVDQQDTARCRCSRCGFSCPREQLDYRYRLSLRVARDGCIFGVTVFGTCLNPFFGIHASGLQRLVEGSDGPVEASTRSTLLLKAVEDCFIGRHFIFGIKVTDAEDVPWSGRVNGSSSKDTPHFIATQMIQPKASGLEGCTVVNYYQRLLQRATDPSTTCRHPATTLLLVPHRSPASSFNNVTLWTSGLLCQSLQRSQHQDCTLTPTPPWQQSLGLVTSSAEQDEGCNTQDSEDENSRQTDFKTLHLAPRGYVENSKVTEETMWSPLSLGSSFYKCPSSFKKAGESTPVLNTWFTPSPPHHHSSKQKRISARKLTETFLSDSLAWEDLPFSESLTEFLCEEKKDFGIVTDTEPKVSVQNQEALTKNNLKTRSHRKNLSHESTSDSQSNTKMADSHSQTLLDITNAPELTGGDRHDVSDHVRKTPGRCVNNSKARNTCNQVKQKASLLCFGNEEQEQLEGQYDCSADLFSSSLMADITNTVNMHEETIRTTAEVCPVVSKPNKRHLRSEKVKVSHLTPDKQKSNKCINRDSLSSQELDFVPPSQSTPIVKVAVVSGSHASYRTSSESENQISCVSQEHLLELGNKKPAATITSSLSKLHCVCANQLCRCGNDSTKENLSWSTPSSSHSHRLTLKRRCWRPNKHKDHQQLGVQRGAPNSVSSGSKSDLSDCDVTVCDDQESEEVIVPPTPAAKTQLSVDIRRKRRTHSNSSNFDFNGEHRHGDGVHCKRTVLDQSLTSSQGGVAQTGSWDSGDTVVEGSLDASQCNFDDEKETCDWSRDLFSDSV